MKEITVQYVQEKYLFRVISRLQTDMEKVGVGGFVLGWTLAYNHK